MSFDGKLLARARDQLAERRARNQQEQMRRQALAYEVIPSLPILDRRLRDLVFELFGASPARPDTHFQNFHHPITGSRGRRTLEEIDEESLRLRASRAELLVRAGFTEDYLDEIFTCPICQDRGYTRDGRMCQCLHTLYQQEQTKELSSVMHTEKDDFQQVDMSYYSTETDERYGISPREAMTIVVDTCRRYADSFDMHAPNLLFRGGTGLGKTFLSACIAKKVVERGYSVVYETAIFAFEAFETSKFSRDTEQQAAADEKIKRILACDLMLLDDLGTEMTTTFTQTALYTLLNTRLVHGRKTVISTNLTAEEMALRYSPQIVSRIRGDYDTLLFLGQDIRSLEKERRYKQNNI